MARKVDVQAHDSAEAEAMTVQEFVAEVERLANPPEPLPMLRVAGCDRDDCHLTAYEGGNPHKVGTAHCLTCGHRLTLVED